MKEHGHCNVPQADVAADGYRLGVWIAGQREQHDRGIIPLDRRTRLDALGFVWDPLAAQWDEGFEHLQAFVQEQGHCNVPQAYVAADGYQLGAWVAYCRKRHDITPADRKARLDALGFVRDRLPAKWEEGFQHLQAFVQEHGHSRVPAKHVTADDYSLGVWVSHQRKMHNITPQRKARLDALGFVWDHYNDEWEQGFQHLQVFVQEHGHCAVPQRHLTEEGYKLGSWVSTQRKTRDDIPAERKAGLEALGFVWDRFADKWEQGFQHLQAFVLEHGHCEVPQKHKTADGYRLGAWLSNQRANKDTMPEERKVRLDALGFDWAPQPSTRRPAARSSRLPHGKKPRVRLVGP